MKDIEILFLTVFLEIKEYIEWADPNRDHVETMIFHNEINQIQKKVRDVFSKE